MKPAILKATFGSFALILALVSVSVAQRQKTRAKADDEVAQRRAVLSKAMAAKLMHSQELIKGLAMEDFDSLADSARTLKQIGLDTLWKVSPNLTYVKYSSEFASLTDELARRAKERDLNGVTLSYVRLTINCVECHKFTRDNRILDLKR